MISLKGIFANHRYAFWDGYCFKTIYIESEGTYRPKIGRAISE